MDKKTKKYMSEIGRKGGKKSRRTLDPETARMMVKVREAQRAYKKFSGMCFWSFDEDAKITAERVPWVAKYLCKNGNRETWELAESLLAEKPQTYGDRRIMSLTKEAQWQFMPWEKGQYGDGNPHPVNNGIDLVLDVAMGRNADLYYDLIKYIETVYPLGMLVWAASAKDPSLNPASILQFLGRQGRYRLEDFEVHLDVTISDLQAMKMKWMAALEDAEQFIDSRPMNEHGCLYYSLDKKEFVQPEPGEANVVCHYGRPGGVLPQIVEV